MRSRLTTLVARLPVRVRVTLAFTLVIVLLLASTGLFLYLRLGSTLNATVDRGLRGRAQDLTAVVRQADSALAESGRRTLSDQGESFAQIVDTRGRIVDAPPGLRAAPLLTPGELRRASVKTIVVEHDSSPVADEPVRVLATPVQAQGRKLIVVVGASIASSEEAQDELGDLLLIGGPIALLIIAVAGYGAAAGALRPVELMRRRASEIQATRLGQRLPVPPSNDEVARLGKTLNEMLGRLEEAFARERAFVADASHELRTPLAILKSELELAMRDAQDVAEFRRSVGSASEEVDRLVQLAEDLLVVARLDQGRLPVRLGEVRVDELLEATSQRFGSRAAEHGVELAVAPAGHDVVVADRLRLEQALGNLVDNALRHGDGRVELSAAVSDGRVELHVRDDGPGFPADFLARAFDRFTRADVARSRGGAGLGLAIAAAIAEGHHGSARARNRSEGGADVWLELPQGPPPA